MLDRENLLNAGVAAQILAAAALAEPREMCGFVVDDHGLGFVLLPNIAPSLDAFVADPQAVLATLRALRRVGGRMLAIVHSHPNGEATFSAADRRLAKLWPGVAQWLVVDGQIVSTAGCRPG